MDNINKIIVGGFLGMILVVSLMGFVLADSFCKVQLGDHQWISVWPGFKSTSADGRFICDSGKCTCHLKSGTGYCTVCTNSSGWYASDTKCKGGLCSANPNNTQEDPLSLTVHFPFSNGGVYTKQSFFMDIVTNKIASIDFIDNVADSSVNLCPNCNTYQKSRTFNQGFNNVTIRAHKGLEFREMTISFFIDNRLPRISKTAPEAKKFTNGEFTVYYDEENLKNVTLYYGTTTLMKTKAATCPPGVGQTCIVKPDLSLFEGKTINYYFEIKDIAGNLVSSKSVQIYVDTKSPIISNISSTVNGKDVNFKIKIIEPYLKTVGYIDNSEARPAEKSLCSKLDSNNVCEKKISFKDGTHNITIYATDLVGNRVEKTVKIVTDGTKPKIKSTLPTSGYADGWFEVQFVEANPKSLILTYGNAFKGKRTRTIDFTKDCSEYKGVSLCRVNVPLVDFNNQDIEYSFLLKDIVESTIESKKVKLKVDTISPVIKTFNYSLVKNFVTFTLNVEDANFYKVTYADNGKTPVTMCSSLKNNVCSSKVSFSRGSHDVVVSVLDKAGNVVARSIEFNVA